MSQNDHYNKNDEFSDLWEMSKNYVPSESAGNDAAWDKLKAQIEVESTKHNTGLSITYRRLLSYAAVLALFALSGYFFFQPTVTTPSRREIDEIEQQNVDLEKQVSSLLDSF